MRDEGDRLLEAIDELLRIGREGGVPAEIWHLKAAGQHNWHKMDAAIEVVEAARAAGQPVTADMYTYTASGTGLASIIPPWFHDGGPRKLLERLEDPAAARRHAHGDRDVAATVGRTSTASRRGPDDILIVGVRKDENRRYRGMTLHAIGEAMGLHPIDAALELVRRDRSRVETVYFMMTEENIRKEIALPWVAFGSDAPSMATEGAFLRNSAHPRAYGNFARLLGKYVRDEGVVPLAEAIRRLTRFPCENLGLAGRGRIEAGCYADIVVFDPATIADRATYQDPHQYAVGVRDVVVNGAVTLRNGEFAGNFAGRAVYGPGKR